MSYLEERKVYYQKELKESKIKKVLKQLEMFGLTIEDLNEYTKDKPSMEKLRDHRSVVAHRKRAKESLEAARRAKQQKLQEKNSG